MTLLAEERRPLGEHGRVIGAVRPVAEHALFHRGGMFPKKGAAFFGMTAITGFIDGLPDELVGACRAVRRMAGGAAHLSGTQGMRRGLEAVGPLPRVTLKTDPGLLREIQNRVTLCVKGVTIGASNLGTLMRAARPMERDRFLMAAATDSILLFDGCLSPLAEGRYLGGASPHDAFRVLAARSVAGLALMPCKRASLVFDSCVPRLEYQQDGKFSLLGMADEAGLGAALQIGPPFSFGLRTFTGDGVDSRLRRAGGEDEESNGEKERAQKRLRRCLRPPDG